MLAQFLSLANSKEEQHRLHELSCGIMMSAYSSDYKSRATIGLRWPKILLTYRRLVCNTKRFGGVTIHSRSRRLKETLYFPVAQCCYETGHEDQEESSKVLCRSGPAILKRFYQAPLRSFARNEVRMVLKEIHEAYTMMEYNDA